MREIMYIALAAFMLLGISTGANAQSYPLYQPANDFEVVDVTLSLDTSIYASADVLAAPQEVTNFCRVPYGVVEVVNVRAQDDDDQGQNFDLLFLNATGSIGAENAAFSPTDAVAATIVGEVAVTDYKDAVGSQYAVEESLKQLVKCDSAGSIYVAAVAREGTPTYTASGIKLKIGVVRH